MFAITSTFYATNQAILGPGRQWVPSESDKIQPVKPNISKLD